MTEVERLGVITGFIARADFVDQSHLGAPYVSKFIDTHRNPTSINRVSVLSPINNGTSHRLRWSLAGVGTSNPIEIRS
jgi:hypothetical protein